MRRFDLHVPGAPFRVRGVSDWFCYVTDEQGFWYSYYTECDPLWRSFPPKLQRFALGVERDCDQKEADECIAAIGLRKIELGHMPEPLEREFIEEVERAMA